MHLSTLFVASTASVLPCLALPTTSTQGNPNPRTMPYPESHTRSQPIQTRRHHWQPTTPESFPPETPTDPRPRMTYYSRTSSAQNGSSTPSTNKPSRSSHLWTLLTSASQPPLINESPKSATTKQEHSPKPGPCKYGFGFNKATLETFLAL
jgi:hypothetical protein